MRVTGNDVGHFVPENTKHQRTVITTFYLLDRYSVPEESCAMVVLSRKKGREKEAAAERGGGHMRGRASFGEKSKSAGNTNQPFCTHGWR